MKIISWNLLHSVGASLDEVEHLVRQEKPDLLLMQETTAIIDGLQARLGGYYARDPLPGRIHGLAAWSRTAFRQPPSTLLLQPGIFVKRICQIIELEHFAVANVHLSHGQLMNRRQLRKIAKILPMRAAVLGDCNLVGTPLLPGFRDVGPRRSTHQAGNIVPLRLDRCFVRGLVCTGAGTLAKHSSDHCPIIVHLNPAS